MMSMVMAVQFLLILILMPMVLTMTIRMSTTMKYEERGKCKDNMDDCKANWTRLQHRSGLESRHVVVLSAFLRALSFLPGMLQHFRDAEISDPCQSTEDSQANGASKGLAPGSCVTQSSCRPRHFTIQPPPPALDRKIFWPGPAEFHSTCWCLSQDWHTHGKRQSDAGRANL